MVWNFEVTLQLGTIPDGFPLQVARSLYKLRMGHVSNFKVKGNCKWVTGQYC